MDTQTPESRALMWTGTIVAAIVAVTLIAYYSGMFSG